jgi:VIT1/CCC1 family predicted Fe2+/Mn2+ transporter
MSFFARHLDPAESLGEILFGLIMVLTFTLGASVAGGWERGLILAAVGCNVAWGIIDGALFVMSRVFERSRRGRLIRAIREAPDAAAAVDAVRREMEPGLEGVTEPADRDRLYRSVHALIANGTPARVRLRRDDWLGALAVFALVTATALPAAAPFLVLRDPHVALRVSNWLLVALLFVVGWRWARHTDANPWVAGTASMGLGVLLVAVAIALGG